MAQNAEAVKSETLSVAFEPELMTRFWQHSAMRLMRANERILHGLMTAATREMELAQDLMRYNLSKIHKFSNSGEPEVANKNEAEEGFKQFEEILTGLREVSQDLWKTFGEASKLLLEGSLAEAQETAIEPVKKAAKQAVAVVDQVSEAARE